MSPVRLASCEITGCDVAWLTSARVELGIAGPSHDIEAYWKRDVFSGPPAWVCASCYWRANFLQTEKNKRGIQRPAGAPAAVNPKSEPTWN